MKKLSYFAFTLLTATTLILACSKEQNYDDEHIDAPAQDDEKPTEAELVTITVSVPEELSKVALSQKTDGGMQLLWQEGDVVTIQKHDLPATAKVFSLSSGAGTNTASFTGEAVGDAESYDIIYNSIGNIALQTQSADGATDHLGYSVSLTGVNTYQDVSFSSVWATSKGGSLNQSGVFHIKAGLPSGVAAVVNMVTIKASENIFNGSNTLAVSISNPGDTGGDNMFNLYATLPAGDITIPAGTSLIIRFGTTDTNHTVYTRYYEFASQKTFYAGKENYLGINNPNIASFAGKDDDGTAAHPYLIGDGYQLQALNTLLSGKATQSITYAKLIDDIDLSVYSNWKPIDCSSKFVFLEGNNKTVENLTFTGGNYYPGLTR